MDFGNWDNLSGESINKLYYDSIIDYPQDNFDDIIAACSPGCGCSYAKGRYANPTCGKDGTYVCCPSLGKYGYTTIDSCYYICRAVGLVDWFYG